MKEIVVYSKKDIDDMKALINSLMLTGTDNFKKVTILSQILDSGTSAEIAEEEKKEVEEECHTNHITK